MCIDSITAKSNVNVAKMENNKRNQSAQEPGTVATANDGLRIKRIAGGYMVQYTPLFSPDGNLLFVIYENTIQAFSVTTGDFVRSYETKPDDGCLIGMVLDSTQGKYIHGCTVDGLILSWKIDSGLLSDRFEVVKHTFVAESFHVLYDQDGVSSFLVFGTSTKKLFVQYCPHKRVVLKIVHPAIHKDSGKDDERNAAAPEKYNDERNVRIVAAAGGYGLNYFAYIARSRWYWVRLKPGVYVDSMPHCSRVQPVVVACHPTDAVLAVGDILGRVVLYRNFLPRGKIVMEIYHWHPHPVNCLAFSSNGTHFYSGGNERVLVKWIVGQEEKADTIPRFTDSIVNIAVGPDNLRMVLGTADNCIHIMSGLHKQTATVQSFSRISGDVPGEELFPAGLCVNPRTHAIIMNGRVGCIQFFSTHTKSTLYTLDITLRNYNTNDDRNVIHNTKVTNIGVNAHWLATVENWNDRHNSMETRLKFWKLNESRQTYSLCTNLENVHQRGVSDIAFSSKSRERDLQCATAGHDHRIKVWSLEEIETTNGGEKVVWVCVGSVQHRHLPVRSISFSQDASLLAGGFGNILCVWNPETLKLKCTLSAAGGYDGCVNRAIMFLPSIGTNEKMPKKTKTQSVYDDARSKILSEMAALINGKGKSSLFENANEKCANRQRSNRMCSARMELIERVSENHKQYIVQKVQTNSKMNMMQRSELFHLLRIRCKTNEKMKERIRSNLSAGIRFAKEIEQCLRKICGNVSNNRQLRVIRKQRNYERRRMPAPFENELEHVFTKKNHVSNKLMNKGKTPKKAQGHKEELANPIKSFAQIQNVLFCYGQFSHLVVITTENRLVVWNLLSLKIQVSAALTVERIALDPITNLIATFTKDNELYVFLPNIPMPLYHRNNMPEVFGAVWVPRRYPSSQSFNVDWQATSQLFFINGKQELLQLVSSNDEESLVPMDSDDEEPNVADDYVNEMTGIFKTPFAAMLTKQAIGSNVHRGTELRPGISLGLGGTSVIRDIVAASSHTMAPVNLLCKDFLRSLLVTEESRANRDCKLQEQIKLNVATDSPNDSNDTANGVVISDEKTIRLSKKFETFKAGAVVHQMKQKQTVPTAPPISVQLGKLSDEFIDIEF